MIKEISYKISPRGIATSFPDASTPPEYATVMRNLTLNANEGAEVRQGLSQFAPDIAGNVHVKTLYEYVGRQDSVMIAWCNDGKTYKLVNGQWVEFGGRTWDVTKRLLFVQFADKLIAFNGIDRNHYTTDKLEEWFELHPLIEVGSMSYISPTRMSDGEVEDWVTTTNVVENDLIVNTATGGRAIVTDVHTTEVQVTAETITVGGEPVSGSVQTEIGENWLDHTTMSLTAGGIGKASRNSQSGDRYRIIDLVELNIIPSVVDPEQIDNIGVAGTNTQHHRIRVSGMTNWHTSGIRTGDYILNTTRNAAVQVTAITSAELRVQSVANQTAGDSLVFLKSALPLTNDAHVHYGRIYMVDERDPKKIRISNSNNPQDMTSDGGTLDTQSFDFGGLQPVGDNIVKVMSFQQFFVILGRQNVFFYSGTQPIGEDSDWTPVASFPHGARSANACINVGNDVIYLSQDSVQSVKQNYSTDQSALVVDSISVPIEKSISEQLAVTSDDEIFMVHYPRRNWVLLKIGTNLWIYNYTKPVQLRRSAFDLGSWSLFDGPISEMSCYFVRGNGDLVCGGAHGKTYIYDQGVYSDDGNPISFGWTSSHMSMEEPKKSTRLKHGKYYKPLFETNGKVNFEVAASASYGRSKSTSVVAYSTPESPSISTPKLPMRWRGETVRLGVSGNTSTGPTVLGRFTLYYDDEGFP